MNKNLLFQLSIICLLRINLLANKQDNKIKISLNNFQDAKKMLNLGTNFLKVDVKINNVIKQKILSLKNVKDNNDLFFQEILTAFLKTKLVIDGKTLFVNDTHGHTKFC